MTPRPAPRRRFPGVLVPVALALAVSATTVPGDFVFDDQLLLQDDGRLARFEGKRVFAENYWGSARRSPNYRPVTLLTYALTFRLSGRPWAFHLGNALLHAAAAAALYLLVREMSGEAAAPSADGRRPFPVAAAAASVFAVLPIHVEAVANVAGRAELLAALAVFAAWRIALRGGRSPALAAAAVAGLVFAGTLAKENAAVAVLLVPAGGWILRRRIPWAMTAAAAGGAVAAVILGQAVLGGSGPGGRIALIDNPLAGVDPVTRAANGIRLLGRYALVAAFPARLVADHSFDQLPVLPLGDAGLWLEAGAVLLGLAVPFALVRRRFPAVALGLAAFPLAFAVTSNILFPIGTIFAERLAYLPSAGLALALGGGLAALAGRSRAAGRAGLAVLAVLVLAGGVRSIARNRDWADAAAFDLRLAEEAPASARAHLKAAEGHLLLARGAGSPGERSRHLALADGELASSLGILPGYPAALAARTMLLLDAGRPAEALRAADEADAAYAREGGERPAEVDLVRAECLFVIDRPAEAAAAVDRYLAARGPSAKALFLRGTCRLKGGDPARALDDLDAALALDPRSATTRMNRGILLAMAGRGAEAARDLDAAVSLAPGDPQVRANRGLLRFQGGDAAGALADYRAGLAACERKGLIAEAAGESVLAFRKRIFDVLARSGDVAGARREIDAIRAIPSPLAGEAARELEGMLPGAEKR